MKEKKTNHTYVMLKTGTSPDVLHVFEHPDFGKLRCIVKNGQPHFFAEDLARI